MVAYTHIVNGKVIPFTEEAKHKEMAVLNYGS